jgi:hypothetical protein
VIAVVDGVCRKCGGPIVPGQRIHLVARWRVYVHGKCPERSKAVPVTDRRQGARKGLSGADRRQRQEARAALLEAVRAARRDDWRPWELPGIVSVEARRRGIEISDADAHRIARLVVKTVAAP